MRPSVITMPSVLAEVAGRGLIVVVDGCATARFSGASVGVIAEATAVLLALALLARRAARRGGPLGPAAATMPRSFAPVEWSPALAGAGAGFRLRGGRCTARPGGLVGRRNSDRALLGRHADLTVGGGRHARRDGPDRRWLGPPRRCPGLGAQSASGHPDAADPRLGSRRLVGPPRSQCGARPLRRRRSRRGFRGPGSVAVQRSWLTCARGPGPELGYRMVGVLVFGALSAPSRSPSEAPAPMDRTVGQ